MEQDLEIAIDWAIWNGEIYLNNLHDWIPAYAGMTNLKWIYS